MRKPLKRQTPTKGNGDDPTQTEEHKWLKHKRSRQENTNDNDTPFLPNTASKLGRLR